MPWLADHSLFRQRQGWPFLADRHPVVPLTTMIRWMAEAAGAAAPGWEVVGLERVRANRWLAAAPPSEVTITATPEGPDRVKVVIEGYAQATVVLGDRMPPAPPPSLDPTADEELSLISAARLYADRWMFHGPSFQSVHEVTAISPSGLRGSLQALPAPGSLLDGAGQLVGYWVMARLATDRVVLPTGVDRIELFGPEPAPGSVVDCAVAITSVDDSSVRADVELVSSGRVWARLSGWTERRFETDGSTWAVHRFPEFNLLSEPRRGGWVLTRERWRRTASRDVIARHYLAGPERAEYERLNPLAQRQWLLGRVAVKDAVRDWLWGHGAGPVFPAEVLTGHDEHGAPTVRGAFGTDLHVSVAHRGSLAVAIAREGAPVGIDVELVAERPERFADVAATPAERALVGLEGEPDMTRLWVAKEAAAKRTGAGLQHNPKRFEVTGVDLPTLAVGDVQVETEAVIEGGETYVVGWTTH
jgi:phosphopantetheinyl transferase (holo-ACP synthase)